ncbi:MAG: Ldh family oxidoreductase, partial [Alphaproteobacteria bacterium]|nr:Ldh family oxidoreductase [Alphaproteobacteria bacterium]
QGRPTHDAEAVLSGGALAPFGGHKGSAIALMVEVMAAALTGGHFGFEDDGHPAAHTKNAGAFVLAIDPGHIAGEAFHARLEELFRRVAANGAARLPGDCRHAARRQAMREGISLERAAYESLLALLPATAP